MMLGMRDEETDVMEYRRGMKDASIFYRHLVQVVQLIEQIQGELADMLGMGRVIEILLTDLFQGFRAVGVRVPLFRRRVRALQEIDHQAIAQAAASDEKIIKANRCHDLMKHQPSGDNDECPFPPRQ